MALEPASPATTKIQLQWCPNHLDLKINCERMIRTGSGALEVLLNRGATAVSSIGSQIGLTSGSIATAVDRLERQGQVERHMFKVN